MKLSFSLLLAAILLVPLSATVADDDVRKKACGLVQDAYDACPDGICKVAIITLNRGDPGYPVKLAPVSRAVPNNPPFDKPISTLENTKLPIMENLKALNSSNTFSTPHQQERYANLLYWPILMAYTMSSGAHIPPIFHLLFCSTHRKNA